METKFHQRLTLLQSDLSNAEFARKLGISPSTLQRYSEGSVPRIDAAAAIADACAVSLDWLTGKGADKLPGSAEASFVHLPRYDIQASAGHGALVGQQETASYLTVSREWLNRYVSSAAHVVVIEARGDSMEPTVRHGDLLMVEMNVDGDHVAAGGVFVIAVAGMIMVKRLQTMLDGALKISSDNRAYDPETVPAAERDDKVIVHGRVFWSGGPLADR